MCFLTGSQHCYYQWKLITPFHMFKHVSSRRVDAINVLIYVDLTDKFPRYSVGSFGSYIVFLIARM